MQQDRILINQHDNDLVLWRESDILAIYWNLYSIKQANLQWSTFLGYVSYERIGLQIIVVFHPKLIEFLLVYFKDILFNVSEIFKKNAKVEVLTFNI